MNLSALCDTVCEGDNGINGCHFMGFSGDIALPTTLWLPSSHHPSTL